MRRIILTGANGFIASAIRHYNSDRYEFINVTRKEIDFSKPETVYPFLMEQDFDAILHTAANAQTEFCANYPEHRRKTRSSSSSPPSRYSTERRNQDRSKKRMRSAV